MQIIEGEMHMENLRYNFRAWDKIEHKMYYLDEYTMVLDNDYWSIHKPSTSNDYCGECETSMQHGILMQSTGLKDAQGKLIFEGDICTMLIGITKEKWLEVNGSIKSCLVVVEYKNASWGFRYMYPEEVHEDDREWKPFWMDEEKELWNQKYFEVVGNIYEGEQNEGK